MLSRGENTPKQTEEQILAGKRSSICGWGVLEVQVEPGSGREGQVEIKYRKRKDTTSPNPEKQKVRGLHASFQGKSRY